MVVRTYRYIIQLLVLVIAGVVIAITQLPDDNLHIIACNVGQGDAILVTYKNIQILTDGGPDSSVLDCLGKYIPFWDRDIELVILSHPDADHLTGLVDVIKRYNVDSILKNPTEVSTEIQRLLENAVGGRGVRVIEPDINMSFRLDLIYLDIVSEYDFTNADTNYNSIVYKLKFKAFSGLFMGDIPPEVSDKLAEQMETVNYIKVPHHGSRNGMTKNLLKVLVPKVAVISVSAKNPWGFPSNEILQMLKDYNNVEVLRTDLMGDVEVISDGERIWWKN
jgi:competence protein ComEC